MGIFDFFKKKDEPAEAAPQPSAEKTPTFMERLRGALKKTKDVLNTDIRDLFKSEGRLVDEPFLDDLFAILVRTDMGVQAAKEIRDRVGSDLRARLVHMPDILATIKTKIRELMEERALALGVSRSHLMHVERGAVFPSADLIDRMSATYKKPSEVIQRAANLARESLAHRMLAQSRELD